MIKIIVKSHTSSHLTLSGVFDRCCDILFSCSRTWPTADNVICYKDVTFGALNHRSSPDSPSFWTGNRDFQAIRFRVYLDTESTDYNGRKRKIRTSTSEHEIFSGSEIIIKSNFQIFVSQEKNEKFRETWKHQLLNCQTFYRVPADQWKNANEQLFEYRLNMFYSQIGDQVTYPLAATHFVQTAT